jgi:rhodanese-related sulfurtransferase
VSASGISIISTNQLNLILGNPEIAIIDVRASKDWQSSNVKIKGAVRGSPKNFESWANDFSKDKVLILY